MKKSNKTRLSFDTQRQIQDSILFTLSSYGVSCLEIAVFGSKADLSAKGGDIDLYILHSLPAGTLDSFEIKVSLKLALEDVLGEQKIDIVLDDGQKNLGAFAEIINETKVVIWTSRLEKNS